MDIDVISMLWESAARIREFFSASLFIAMLKFFLFIYVVVLLLDIIMLFMAHGVSSDLKKTIFGAERPLLTRSKAIERWENILARLKSPNPSQLKVAVLEADAFAEEIMLGIGYEGTTMAEKLQHVKAGQLETKEILTEAHGVRNRIVHEADFVLTPEAAEQCLESYKKFLDEVELF